MTFSDARISSRFRRVSGRMNCTPLPILSAQGYVLFDKNDYRQTLPVRLEWETNFGTDTYFDATFYWYD